ncbi:hypothetical protein KPSA3_07597 [Pseudomonas syringae pv. actinidiae]|uniref:Uncharacterized protein n=1 Tax=Pseudomonas syringae pv. actinidiae TaxID=103796 RepID=A0AAN4QCL8_PSESF|nr:hypothetical protein KPSA3_07597 [Pseudomonas syringae pv. actinidiae]
MQIGRDGDIETFPSGLGHISLINDRAHQGLPSSGYKRMPIPYPLGDDDLIFGSLFKIQKLLESHIYLGGCFWLRLRRYGWPVQVFARACVVMQLGPWMNSFTCFEFCPIAPWRRGDLKLGAKLFQPHIRQPIKGRYHLDRVGPDLVQQLGPIIEFHHLTHPRLCALRFESTAPHQKAQWEQRSSTRIAHQRSLRPV